MGVLKEFKEFAMRGNVVDLAVGIVIGSAFQKIVTSTVNDLLMPPIGFLIGGVKFNELKFSIGGISGLEPVTVNYGNFIQTIFDFLIVAFAIFMLVKGINRLKERMERKSTQDAIASPPEPSSEEKLLMEIRDELRSRKL